MSKITTFIALTFKTMPEDIKAAGIEGRAAWLAANPDFYKTIHRAGRWSDAAIKKLAIKAGAVAVEAYTAELVKCRMFPNSDRRVVAL